LPQKLFAGIRPFDAPGFILAQLIGAFAATVLFRWLVPSPSSEAKEVIFHTPTPAENDD
jgi:glycerol uptake facilitator-like aquaporin